MVAISSRIEFFSSCIVYGRLMYTCSFKYPHAVKSGTVRSGEISGCMMLSKREITLRKRLRKPSIMHRAACTECPFCWKKRLFEITPNASNFRSRKFCSIAMYRSAVTVWVPPFRNKMEHLQFEMLLSTEPLLLNVQSVTWFPLEKKRAVFCLWPVTDIFQLEIH